MLIYKRDQNYCTGLYYFTLCIRCIGTCRSNKVFFTSSLVISCVVYITSVASKLNEHCRDFRSNIPVYCNLYSLSVINVLLLLLLLLLLTEIELSLGGSRPYTTTDKTNKNKYT
jgi:hypothetical protein